MAEGDGKQPEDGKSDDEAKPRAPASMPPAATSRAEHAAKRLGFRGHSGRNEPAKPNGALGRPNTHPSVRPVAPASVPPISATAVPSGPVGPVPSPSQPIASEPRHERYGKRLVASDAPPAKEASAIEKSSARKKQVRSAAALVGVALLVLAITGIVRLSYESSDEGRVRAHLIDVEFAPRDPAARERSYAEIDKLARGATAAIDLLTDAHVAERTGSRSTHRMQELANAYLLHHAGNAKREPPPKAIEVEKSIFEGVYPMPDQWQALQQAWRAWLDAKK